MDGEYYAADVTQVKKIVRNVAFSPIPAAPDTIAGIANMKGRIVTILSLAELIGREKGEEAVNAVVFKPLADDDNQIGLLIDKPGDLIDIDENEILPLPRTAREKEKLCISGIAEVGGMLYRIVNVDSIISRFKDDAENDAGTIS